VIAYGALAVTLGIRYLNVVDHGASHEAEEAKEEAKIESLPETAKAG
jgi:hypothetical protein